MSFLENFEYGLDAPFYDKDDEEYKSQRMRIENTSANDMRIVTYDRFGNHAVMRLSQAQAEELAVALTYALSSDE